MPSVSSPSAVPERAPLTPQQHAAITGRDVSIGLSAGAGSGKTHVLTQRFLSHLDPSGPDAKNLARLDELIAITFTEAAAREMRDRVREACFDQLEHSRPDDQDDWYRLLRALDAARISTIHSFCGSLLRRHAVEAGVDPRFGVLDENQAEVLRSQLVDDLLRAKLADRDEAVLDMAHVWGIAGLRTRTLVMMTHAHDVGFAGWSERDDDALLDVWEHHVASSEFRQAIVDRVVGSYAARNVMRILRSAIVDDATFRERRAVLLDRLPRLAETTDLPADLLAIREAAMVQGIDRKSAWETPRGYERFKDACRRLRETIDSLKLKEFDRDLARPVAERALRLYRLACEAISRYETEKSALAKLDFDDLVARAAGLLIGPKDSAVKKIWSDGVRAILVDEFQDTDPQQAALIRALCGDAWQDGRLFFVGDVKQSVYRFRGAAPEVFRQLRADLPRTGKLSLTKCFRSQPAVLDFVNVLFLGVWGSEYEPLESTRSQTTPEPAVEFLWTVGPEDDESKGRAGRMRKAEAHAIAGRLSNLIESEMPLIPESLDTTRDECAAHALRPIRPGDVAILFRALTDVAYYEHALQEAGLDYYLVGGHAFYAQQEVYDLVNLLRAVASTADEISLAGALRSPFFSLADESLYWLMKDRGDGSRSLAAGLMAGDYPQEMPEREREKAARAARVLTSLRAMKDHVSIAELIDAALAKTGYDATLLAEFLGERKLANLRKLQRQARAADQEGVLDLHGFITQLGEFVARMPKEPPASSSAETADVIRLMTVHQAKGLEFPCVVLADIDRPSQSGRDSVAFSPELGPLVRLTEDEKNTGAMIGFEMFRRIEDVEDRQEAARLFYVACTRAADYLILSGSFENCDAPRGEWARLLSERFDLQSGRGCSTALRAVHDGSETRPTPEVRVMQHVQGSTALETVDDESESRPPPSPPVQRRPSLKRVIESAHQASANAPPMSSIVAPIAPDRTARRRFSFSRLTGAMVALSDADADAESAHDTTGSRDPTGSQGVAPPPIAAQTGPLHPVVDPRRLGSMVHAMLEIMEPGGPLEPATLAARLVPRFFDDAAVGAEHPAVAEGVPMVERYVASPRAASIASAPHVFRELEFQLAWPPNSETPDGHYLHGFLDCLYEDTNGNWVVVDFKTNRIGSGGAAQAATGYRMQLFVYALAVEATVGKWPSEMVVHFLRTGGEHRFRWTPHERTEMIDQVNRAMERVVQPSAESSG